jgi:hypothetical protein
MAFQDNPITPHPVVKPEYDDLLARFKVADDKVATLSPFVQFVGEDYTPQSVVTGTIYYAAGRAFKRVGPPAALEALDPQDPGWELVAGHVQRFRSSYYFPAAGDPDTLYVDMLDFKAYVWDPDSVKYWPLNYLEVNNDLSASPGDDAVYSAATTINLASTMQLIDLTGSYFVFTGNSSRFLIQSGQIFVNRQENMDYEFQLWCDEALLDYNPDHGLYKGYYYYLRQAGANGRIVVTPTPTGNGPAPTVKYVGCTRFVQPGQTLLVHHTGRNELTLYPAFGTPPIDPVTGSPVKVVLYGTTGQNSDGAMTQKAVTDALNAAAAAIGGVFRGEWAVNTRYLKNDLVTRNGYLYRALAANQTIGSYLDAYFRQNYARFAVTEQDLNDNVYPYLMPNMEREQEVRLTAASTASTPGQVPMNDNNPSFCLRGGGYFNLQVGFYQAPYASSIPRNLFAVRVPTDEPAAVITLNYSDDNTIKSGMDGQRYVTVQPGEWLLLATDVKRVQASPDANSCYYNIIIRSGTPSGGTGGGTAKLYDSTGQATDGAMTQKATTDALGNKADLVGGLVPAYQLPSYVDDVLEFSSIDNFPQAGERGKIYIDVLKLKQYRWTGTSYTVLSDSGLTINEVAALHASNNPSATNPIATMADIPAGGGSGGGGSAILYGTTGQHTDGAMTQKATTDALGNKADLVGGIVPLYELPYKPGTNVTITGDGTIDVADHTIDEKQLTQNIIDRINASTAVASRGAILITANGPSLYTTYDAAEAAGTTGQTIVLIGYHPLITVNKGMRIYGGVIGAITFNAYSVSITGSTILGRFLVQHAGVVADTLTMSSGSWFEQLSSGTDSWQAQCDVVNSRLYHSSPYTAASSTSPGSGSFRYQEGGAPFSIWSFQSCYLQNQNYIFTGFRSKNSVVIINGTTVLLSASGQALGQLYNPDGTVVTSYFNENREPPYRPVPTSLYNRNVAFSVNASGVKTWVGL